MAIELMSLNGNMRNILSFLIVYLCLKQGPVLSITVRKFVYQKDMSEHCKRRAVPSVFLGRRIVEAHSQILHFSRMELPYSCFISIRAESGNHIVLVVQLLSEESLASACSENPSQLLVHEMGETFGGYWGPLPEFLLRDAGPVALKQYTRKTTPTTEVTTYETETESPETAPESTTASKVFKEKEKGDFVTVEVPIVDVSGVMVDNEEGQKHEAFDPDESFDLLYDVTPRLKGKYRTKIIPLVQFAIRTRDGRREGEPRFDLEYGEPYTADARFTLSQYGVRTTKPRNVMMNHNKKFNNYGHTISSFRTTKLNENKYFTTYMTLNNLLTSSSTKSHLRLETRPIIHDWKDVKKTIKKLNESDDVDKYQNENKNITSILESVANMRHNSSVYLVSNWSSLTNQDSSIHYMNTTQRFKTFTKTPLKLVNYVLKNIHDFKRTTVNPILLIREVKTLPDNFIQSTIKNVQRSLTTNNHSTFNIRNNTTTVRLTSSVTQNDEHGGQKLEPRQVTLTENYSIANFTTKSMDFEITKFSETSVPMTGPMVGHESWENVVQAAPVMAVLLNKTVNNSTKFVNSNDVDLLDSDQTTTRKEKGRMKRNIRPISIENARPRNLTTRQTTTTTAVSFRMSDMQNFAQLVELHDDELHDRVALRYLRQYVGTSRFNICGNGEPKARHVYLFNSSRVVIQINNFTLDRMTVMLTPARTLLGGDARCSSASLECQVHGTRICIDAMNACDGVPNCGAYDIYDEDRLMCGAAGGLQHNVYLAAVTFLALLLTVMYTVHYWLRRCVPKVSEAFFIYTDGSENILYLESVMRSPHDLNDSIMKMAYHGNLEGDDYLYPNIGNNSPISYFRRIIKVCFKWCKCKKLKKQKSQEDIEDEPYTNYNEPRQMYSFAELELSKMLYQTDKADIAIQTGDSLEMSQINILELRDSVERVPYSSQKRAYANRGTVKASVSMDTVDEHFQTEMDELKYFKDVKSDPTPSTSHDVSGEQYMQGSLEEKILRSHVYDHHPEIRHESTKDVPYRTITTTCDVHAEKPESSKRGLKRLRFDEEAIAIPYDDDSDQGGIQQVSNIALSDKDHDTDKIESSGSGMGRDFKRFWKSKKSKKKTQLSIR